ERVWSLNLTEEQQPHEVVIDTGSSWTMVPGKFFTMVLDAIQAEVGPQRVGWRSVRTHPTDVRGLNAILRSDDRIVVRRTIVDRLPVIVFTEDVNTFFELHLSNHVQVCDEGGWCYLSLERSLKSDPAAFQLGQPFFIEHDLYVNFDRSIVGIATPARPGVNEATSNATLFRSSLACSTRLQQEPNKRVISVFTPPRAVIAVKTNEACKTVEEYLS
ncbi:hypothetical protein FOZ63_027537, partial [Perkinsus olseni]